MRNTQRILIYPVIQKKLHTLIVSNGPDPTKICGKKQESIFFTSGLQNL